MGDPRRSTAGPAADAGAAGEMPLRMMTLALTGECNLKCRYCYQNAKSGTRMPPAVLQAAAARVLESTGPLVDVIFAGGEPLLAFDLVERAVERIESRRPAGLTVRYSLATNGTLLTPGTIAFLDARRFDIDLSFDGVPPAQAVRGTGSFARIDRALDDLRELAPETFRRRLTAGITLDADAVPYLAESFSYFLRKQIGSVLVSPAAGQAARRTPAVLAELERQLNEVYALVRRHYEETGAVPLVAFRGNARGRRGRRQIVCGAADVGRVTVDVDGQAYACPMLAESSQRFANPGLAALVRPMRMGTVAGPGFWAQVAALPGRARATGIFQIGPRRRSLHGQCIRCPHRRDCKACPISVLSEPGHGDAQRIPDYICAFNWTLVSLWKTFPVQPAAAPPPAGPAPRPRLARDLRESAPATSGRHPQ